MPLDKMSEPEEYIPTHKSTTLHIKSSPAACIIDENTDESSYSSMMDNSNLKASLIGFLNRHENLGLLMGFKLKIQTDSEFFEYTVYPDEYFIDTVIFNESIFIINSKMENLFLLRKIVTDQFVKTKTEFDKLQKMMP
ncbi:MAG: hypothetical protein ACRBB5_01840 [Nitrosopumilus sp.]